MFPRLRGWLIGPLHFVMLETVDLMLLWWLVSMTGALISTLALRVQVGQGHSWPILYLTYTINKYTKVLSFKEEKMVAVRYLLLNVRITLLQVRAVV